jgi:hypothetical protein
MEIRNISQTNAMEKKLMNKDQFAQREYAMSARRFNQRNVRKTKKARKVHIKSIGIKWIISDEKNNRIYPDEARIKE